MRDRVSGQFKSYGLHKLTQWPNTSVIAVPEVAVIPDDLIPKVGKALYHGFCWTATPAVVSAELIMLISIPGHEDINEMVTDGVR